MTTTETNSTPTASVSGRRHYPDWTPAQQELLRHIYSLFGDQTAGPGRKQLRWSRAFSEHPEWKDQLLLLPDGSPRPESHLWHTAKQLAMGLDITRPNGSTIYKMARGEKPVKRGPYRKKKRGGAWWIRQGVPHPGSKEAREAKLKLQAARAVVDARGILAPAEPSQPQLHHCPQCGMDMRRVIVLPNADPQVLRQLQDAISHAVSAVTKAGVQ